MILNPAIWIVGLAGMKPAGQQITALPLELKTGRFKGAITFDYAMMRRLNVMSTSLVNPKYFCRYG